MELETPVLTALIAGAVALFGVLANHRLSVHRENAAALRKFAATLQEAIAALAEPRNVGRDAFAVLEARFPVQHSGYLIAFAAAGPLRRRRLLHAWNEYYGQGPTEDAEWWLPNEYSTVLSNQLANTSEGTRKLATERLENLVRVCA